MPQESQQETLTFCGAVSSVVKRLLGMHTPEELKLKPYVRLHVEDVKGEVHLYFRIAHPVILPTDAVVDMEGTTVLCNLAVYRDLCGCEIDFDGSKLKHRIAA